MAKKVSMQDIADRLQISKNAVSLALAGKRGVSDETRELVIGLAKKLRYANFSDKEERRKTCQNVLICIPEYIRNDSFFYNDIYWSIDYRAGQKGLNTVIATVTTEMQREMTLPPICRQMEFIGALIVGILPDAYVKFLIGQYPDILSIDHVYYALDINCIVTANLQGSFLLTQKVIEFGHKKIGFVGSYDMTSSIYERWCGFQKAMRSAGLQVDPGYNISDDSPLDILLSNPSELIQKLNAFKNMPTAFICGGDRIAIAMINALKSMGYKIPEQISIAGFDDIEIGRFTEPELTTMHVKRKEMGRLAVDLLLKKIDGKNAASMYALNPEYICRNSLTWAQEDL